MASNSFGSIFRVTTFGESHGPAIGCVIDGCPSGIAITEEDINAKLASRAPGRNPYTSERSEKDKVEVISGIFEGITTGAPITLLIRNVDADSSSYEPIKDILRPGHANFTYLEKYGVFDFRGGGRASARETAARVAAGSIAGKFLEQLGISIICYLKKLGPCECDLFPYEQEKKAIGRLQKKILSSPLFTIDSIKEAEMQEVLTFAKEKGDSLGGVVECIGCNIPLGLGDPVYEKISAKLAFSMLSIPGCKGFEIGEGFSVSNMSGFEHNDVFTKVDEKIVTKTNHAGGLLGGITTGMPLIIRSHFKPTASIAIPQESTTITGEKTVYSLPKGSRHDPALVIRAVPVVEAMMACVLVDAYLLDRSCRFDYASFVKK